MQQFWIVADIVFDASQLLGTPDYMLERFRMPNRTCQTAHLVNSPPRERFPRMNDFRQLIIADRCYKCVDVIRHDYMLTEVVAVSVKSRTTLLILEFAKMQEP
jgi:hypothetical protein